MTLSRQLSLLGTLAVGLVALLVPQASAAFGLLPGTEGFDAALERKDGTPERFAGAHPYAFHLSLGFNATAGLPDGDLREAQIELPAGLLINPTAVDQCNAATFHTPRTSPYEESLSGESCPNASQVGVAAVKSSKGGGQTRYFGIFNLNPPNGSPGAFGFAPYGVPVILTSSIREADSGLDLELNGLPQSIDFSRIELSLWGFPWSYDHDGQRGNCLNETDPAAYHGQLAVIGKSFTPGTCTVLSPAALEELGKSYVTAPTTPTTPCGVPLDFALTATSWQGAEAKASIQSHDAEGHPIGLEECRQSLTIAKVALTTERTAVGSGLDFTLAVNDGGGITNPLGIARPAIRKAVVSLPEGLTINPSVGAGLGVCTQADLARERFDSAPGQGCPNNSNVGEVKVAGMLGLPEPVQGSLYVAKPYENPTSSLIALYIVARSKARGILVKSTGKIEPDPKTGRLTATFEDLPRLLYTNFNLKLREGQRAMLISPPSCGTYPSAVEMSSWAPTDPPDHEAASFPVSKGREGGSCPPPGAPPFAPALEAGSMSAGAGSYAPFYLHMTRTDPEQEITSYSATFPPGLLGKLAGIPYCPEAAIAAARANTGTAEKERPSCPAASQIGSTLAGYGIGGVLAYAPGRLYLAGPYHGAPLSTVAVNSALVGPFDLGTVIVRSAIRVNPRSAQASIDSSGSDPIPQILEGIPIHIRDIRVYVDRPGFTLNPTSCDPLQALSTLTGAGTDFSTAADDPSAISTDRFQVLNCQALGFSPKLSFKRKGDTRRGRFPSLRATYTPKAGNANLRSVSVTLPPSLFLAQEHIDTVCTRPQFAAHACPPGSIYGHATAITPLLDEPFEGPVYLRSSDHTVPDIVADLYGRGFRIEVAGRIDSDHKAIRATFEGLPDAPVSKFTMKLNGGKKGILVNTGRVCSEAQLAEARFIGQNSKTEVLRPKVRARCGGHHRGGHQK